MIKAEITSLKNEKVKFAVSLKEKKNRDELGLFLLEGEKLLSDAFRAGLEIKTVFSSAEDSPDVGAKEFYRVPQQIIEKISEAKNPQSVVAVAKKPEIAAKIKKGGRYILLENVSDPGNFGGIIRSAECFGFDAVLAVGACADAFSTKAVRGSMGSLFRMPVLSFDTPESASKELKLNEITLAAAELRKTSEEPKKLPKSGICVAIGNEGAGLSKELSALADMSVAIPQAGAAESLSAGVAAAVLMWEIYYER